MGPLKRFLLRREKKNSIVSRSKRQNVEGKEKAIKLRVEKEKEIQLSNY